jgi:hypothetical protein
MKYDMFRGEVKYRDIWSTAKGDFAIDPVNCVGLSADACRDKCHATLATNNIPDTDEQGNCLTCWPHQEPLEPVMKETGELVYKHPHAHSEGGECMAGEIARDTFQAIDAGVENALTRTAEMKSQAFWDEDRRHVRNWESFSVIYRCRRAPSRILWPKLRICCVASVTTARTLLRSLWLLTPFSRRSTFKK